MAGGSATTSGELTGPLSNSPVAVKDVPSAVILPSEAVTLAEPSEPVGEGGPPAAALPDLPPATPVDKGTKSTKPDGGEATASPLSPVPTAAARVNDVIAATAVPPEAPAPAEPATQTATAKSDAFATVAVAAAVMPLATNAQFVTPATGFVGLFNSFVTNMLNPFLAPAPATGDPFTPVAWAILAWVRRSVFNQAPVIAYNPTTTVQTGQTLTGNLGATDPEGDALTYKVTKGPKYGTLTIDQTTGEFTYTPDDIDYDAVQTDSFTVTASDGKFNLLTFLSPHRDKEKIDVAVLNPIVERVILNMPDSITSPVNPRFSEDGTSVFFSGNPTAGGRAEIYRIAVDGEAVECVTCGLPVPGVPDTTNLGKPIPFADGSGKVLVRVGDQGSVVSGNWAVLEEVDGVSRLVPIITPPPAPGTFVISGQREMRISPDGKHVAFTQLVLNSTQTASNGYVGAVPVVGTFTLTTNAVTGAPEYHIDDARVVYPIGEIKQWAPDGKGVVVLGGQYELGNVDDVLVNLETGEVTRITANLDYDEDMDYSPNQQWIAIGSTRTLDALIPMSQIVRPGFLLFNIFGIVYEFYADPVNLSNQEWLVAVEDELKRENGLPLFVVDDPHTAEDEGDGYTARSMPSWNPTGDAIAFWESNVDNPADSRLVIANLKYTTSVGPVTEDRATPDYAAWNPPLLSASVPEPPRPPLSGVGRFDSARGGFAQVSESTGDADPGFLYPGPFTVRTVEYHDYVNDDGMVLNGTESMTSNGNQTYIGYRAHITVTDAVTGEDRGYLIADGGPSGPNGSAKVLTTQSGQIYVGNITSELDGKELTLMDPDRLAGAVGSA